LLQHYTVGYTDLNLVMLGVVSNDHEKRKQDRQQERE